MTTIMDNNYNLTKIFSEDAISNPSGWLVNFNNVINGFLITTGFYAIAIVLFIAMKRQEGVEDTEAALYTGLIMSVTGMLLYLIEPFFGVKLLSWDQYVPILFLTSAAIGIRFFNKRF